MPKPHNYFCLSLICIMLLIGCGGGGGGGGSSFGLNSGPVSGSFDPMASTLPVYTFQVQTGMTYTINLVSTSGDADLLVANDNLNTNPSATLLGYSWNSNTSSTLDQVSFVATYDGAVYVSPFTFSTTAVSFTVEATSNNLTVDAAPVTDDAYNTSLYYSFDAQAGVTYQVSVTPSKGDVNIGAVSPRTDLASSVGSSSNTGTTVDSVYFTAAATQRYYVRVSSTSTDSTFDISVNTVPADPDLSVNIDSAVSDGTNVIVNYTVYNYGANTYNGDVQVDVWSNAASAPVIGSTGEGYQTLTGASIAGLGGSVSGMVSVPNTANSGTAYAIVDTIQAILEGNENNNVSNGTAWTKPIIAPASFDFETGTVPTDFVSSGDASWFIDNTTGGSGSSTSLRSGVITDSQSSCFEATAYNAQGTQISFDYSVSSEQFYDYLKFYIDGTLIGSWSGTVAWTTATYSASSGVHTYKWCYTKDFVNSVGSDAAWVDNISITQLPIDLSVTVDSVSSDGTNVTVNYTVTNNGTGDAGAFAVDLWSDSASAPVVGNTGEASQSYTSLTAGSSVSGSAVIANAAASGTAYAIVDTSNVVQETVETNNVSTGVAWVPSYPDLSVTIVGVSSDGTNITINYTVTNNGLGDAGAFAVDLWSDSASAPVVGNTGESTQSYTSLTVGSSVSGTAVIANAAASGTSYAIVDTSNAVQETDETNNVSTGTSWQTPPTAPLSYNFESGPVPATLSMSGNAGWTLDSTAGAGTSTASLRSGVITHSQTSCTTLTVLNTSSIAFDYLVSSESGFDFLIFYIDNVQQNTWSGTSITTWTNTSYTVTTGTHTYKWCYTKDGSVSSGSDAAWVDNISAN